MKEPSKILLTGEKELRIFMHPLRQRMLRAMELCGEPMTAKQLADTLKITPSSAKHHLVQLESIGLVAVHHHEQIHGITATYYVRLPVYVSIGLDRSDLPQERRAVSDNLLSQIYEGFLAGVPRHENDSAAKHFEGDLLSGVVHLTQQDADELYGIILNFIDGHQTAGTATIPFEFALILYNASGVYHNK